MRGSPYLLWEQAPGIRSEHGVTATINSLGLRGPEPVVPKPKGVKRLLATGDSSVYGFGVEDDEPFIQVAARLLDVEGHNAAIPGYSTLQTINLLEMRALALEPDVVVIANLWSDNNFDSFVDKDLLNAYTRFEHSPRARLERALRPLALYRLLHWRLVTQSEQAQARTVGWTVGGGEPTGLRRVAVNDYAANIDRIAHMSLDAGAELVFVVLPNQLDLVDDANPKAWTVYRQVLGDAATRFGAPLVDGSTLFRGGDGLLLDEMHPTPEGHRVLGVELARVLEPWANGGTAMGAPDRLPVASYDDPFPFGDGGGPATTSAAVSGRLIWTHGGPVQVEAVDLGGASQGVVGQVTLDAPDSFTMTLQGRLSRVGFVVSAEEAPGEPAQRHEFFGTPLDLSAGGQGLVLNLDAGQLQRESSGPGQP